MDFSDKDMSVPEIEMIEARFRLLMPEALRIIENDDRAYEDSIPTQSFLRNTYFVI